MTLAPLDNLVKSGLLKSEPPDRTEFDGLRKSGTAKLKDTGIKGLSAESRFDLTYNAAHALSLAALRWHGYRPDNKRYIVFQTLEHTLDLRPELWRVLDKAHRQRNLGEYEGRVEVNQQLLADLLTVAQIVCDKLAELGPVPQP